MGQVSVHRCYCQRILEFLRFDYRHSSSVVGGWMILSFPWSRVSKIWSLFPWLWWAILSWHSCMPTRMLQCKSVVKNCVHHLIPVFNPRNHHLPRYQARWLKRFALQMTNSGIRWVYWLRFVLVAMGVMGMVCFFVCFKFIYINTLKFFNFSSS